MIATHAVVITGILAMILMLYDTDIIGFIAMILMLYDTGIIGINAEQTHSVMIIINPLTAVRCTVYGKTRHTVNSGY